MTDTPEMVPLDAFMAEVRELWVRRPIFSSAYWQLRNCAQSLVLAERARCAEAARKVRDTATERAARYSEGASIMSAESAAEAAGIILAEITGAGAQPQSGKLTDHPKIDVEVWVKQKTASARDERETTGTAVHGDAGKSNGPDEGAIPSGSEAQQAEESRDDG